MAEIRTDDEGLVYINDQPIMEIIGDFRAKLRILVRNGCNKNISKARFTLKLSPNEVDTLSALLDWFWVAGTTPVEEPEPEAEKKSGLVGLDGKPS